MIDRGKLIPEEVTTDDSGDYKIAGKVSFSNDSVRTYFTYINTIRSAEDICNGAFGEN